VVLAVASAFMDRSGSDGGAMSSKLSLQSRLELGSANPHFGSLTFAEIHRKSRYFNA
jgi:hypothetical protein